MTHKQITKKTLYQIASIYKIKKRSYMNKAELLINIRRTYLIKKYFYTQRIMDGFIIILLIIKKFIIGIIGENGFLQKNSLNTSRQMWRNR